MGLKVCSAHGKAAFRRDQKLKESLRSGTGSIHYSVSLICSVFTFPSCFGSPGADARWACMPVGADTRRKPGVALCLSLSIIFFSLQVVSLACCSPVLIYCGPSDPVLCLQTPVASRAGQLRVPLTRCHVLHLWCGLAARGRPARGAVSRCGGNPISSTGLGFSPGLLLAG